MVFLIYGSQTKAIGIFEPLFYKCPNCEEMHTTYIVISSVYFSFFWIPVFPYQKKVAATCSECSFLRDELKFGPALISEFEGKINDYKHPWWTYFLSAIVGLCIVVFFLSVI